jgi:hypothetical protein
MKNQRCYVLLGPKGKFHGVAATAEEAWGWVPLASMDAAYAFCRRTLQDAWNGYYTRETADRLKSLGWRVKEARVSW